jgi:hypothetical protein
VRRRLTVLFAAAALALVPAACSGDDDDAGKQAAEAPPAAATEGTKTERRAARAEKKGPKKEKRISEASTAPEKEPAAPDTGARQKAPKRSGGAVPAGKVQATNGSPPEVTLAVIDAKSAYVKKSLVKRYAEPLDSLERTCTEPREQLAESALTASHDVESQTDSKLSILDVLREVVNDDPSGVCLPAFTAVAERHGAS